jgi:hypothetical protein
MKIIQRDMINKSKKLKKVVHASVGKHVELFLFFVIYTSYLAKTNCTP